MLKLHIAFTLTNKKLESQISWHLAFTTGLGHIDEVQKGGVEITES
jgi:hypothetical protein